MKILFFITSSMEKPSPSWHLMKALLEDTLQAGFEVHAIQRHFLDYDGIPFPETILNHPNFSYSLINTKKEINKRNFVKRFLNGYTYSLKSKKAFKNNNDFDMVFVQSAPTSMFYIRQARKYAKKRPVLYNSQDMFPGSAIANGSMPKKWMQSIFYKLQKKAYDKTNLITAISEDMKNKLIEQNVHESKIKVIVNWYDDTTVKEVSWEENKFVEKYNLSKDKFYVQYAGTLGTNFNPDIIVEVAEILKENTNIEFQIIGNGVRKASFEAKVKEKNLNNVTFYPLQPQELVSDVYSACSACIIPLKKGVIGNSVPSKAALLMACRRVIINSVDENSDYANMFEREKIGFSASTTDANKIAKDILYLYNNPIIKEEYENRAKEYGLKWYSRGYNTKKYIQIFKECIEANKND